MRTAALFLAWCGLMAWAHWRSPDPGVAGRPISEFRDGSQPAIGYSLFVVLIAAVLSHARGWWVRREVWSCYVSLAVASGLVVVAATPSNDRFHQYMALAVIGIGELYFTVSLYREFLEWNDPFLRSIHRRGVVEMKIPLAELRIAGIWRWVVFLHQGVFLLAVVLIPTLFQSWGILQKFIVTHLLLLLVILEILPRRRSPRGKRRRAVKSA